MRLDKPIIDLEKLINVFSLFVIGTISFILKYFVLVSYSFPYKESLSFALFITGILTYEFIILTIIPYYTAKSIKHYNEHKKLYFWCLVFVLALTYSITDAVKDKSFLIFIRDIALILLTVIIGPKIANKITGHKTEG